jgi:hypothetical protein
MENFNAALDKFVTEAQAIVDRDRNAKFPMLARSVLTAEPGRRYVKIVVCSEGQSDRSVYCFVDSTNGDILKAASWKAPAKYARGNVLSGKTSDAVTHYGAMYLR